MSNYYDDNYGHWENMEEEGMKEFYNDVQRNSVMKRCKQCERMVKLRRDYAICNSCADSNERGGY